MAKDDYNNLIYYLLKYLYEVKKAGVRTDIEYILFNHYPETIPEEYANFIIKLMYDEGFIKGFKVIEAPILGRGKDYKFVDLEHTTITLKGLEYLSNNSLMSKAYETLKQFKDIIPFI